MCLYRGPVIYGVKGSVPVFILKLHPRGERGRKGRECKFPKIAHRTFDTINSWPPVYMLFSTFDTALGLDSISIACKFCGTCCTFENCATTFARPSTFMMALHFHEILISDFAEFAPIARPPQLCYSSCSEEWNTDVHAYGMGEELLINSPKSARLAHVFAQPPQRLLFSWLF